MEKEENREDIIDKVCKLFDCGMPEESIVIKGAKKENQDVVKKI